jgi:S1-C subfamily serine protease
VSVTIARHLTEYDDPRVLLLGGDVILCVNEIKVTENDGSYEPIYNSIGTLKPGDSLVIKVFRQGQIFKLSIPIEP